MYNLEKRPLTSTDLRKGGALSPVHHTVHTNSVDRRRQFQTFLSRVLVLKLRYIHVIVCLQLRGYFTFVGPYSGDVSILN